MEIAYQNEFKDKVHECGTLLIRCMDFRFHKALEDNIAEIVGEPACAFDSPGIGGGGSKSVIDEDSRKVVFGALDIAVSKHHVKRVIIADHIDCGAYGGSNQHQDAEAEEKFHIEKLNEAREILQGAYPGLKIILLYQDWDSIKKIS